MVSLQMASLHLETWHLECRSRLIRASSLFVPFPSVRASFRAFFPLLRISLVSDMRTGIGILRSMDEYGLQFYGSLPQIGLVLGPSNDCVLADILWRCALA
jgi:hypothetical protein